MGKADIRKIYAAEASETLDRIEDTLQDAVDAPENLDCVRTLRRDLHTLKGGAYAIGFTALGELFHALEDAFPAERAASTDALASAQLALGVIADSLQVLGAGDQPADDALVQALEVVRGGAQAPAASADAPAASEREPVADSKPAAAPEREPVAASQPPAAPEREPVAASQPPAAGRAETVGRVNLATLEELAGRLIEARGISGTLAREARTLLQACGGRVLTAAQAELAESARRILEHALALEQSLSDAAYQSEQLRLRPVERLLHDARRAFDDALDRSGKRGRMVINGGEILLDRRVAERIQAMVAHIVRNAVDHGFDSPEARRAAGKPGDPTLTVRVVAQGIRVEFQIEDDGAGIDLKAVRRRALERELIDTSEEPTDEALLALVFQSGFSTREEVSSLSGRGIGLDVVRSTVEAMNGRVRLSSTPGQGTRLQFEVPVSLATSRVLLVRRGAQRLAVPLLAADRVLDLSDVDLEPVGGRRTFVHQGARIALTDLADLYALEADTPDRQAVVVGVGDRRLALGVDQVEEEVEVAIRPIGEPIHHCPLTAGLALLSDASIVPVVDLAEAVRVASTGRRRRRGTPVTPAVSPEAARAAGEGATVLIVDDSVTTRTLETDIFAQAGYEALAAKDGAAALAVLAEREVDLVVTDLEMPAMDGLELLERIRATAELASLPVIVVTSRSDRKDRCLSAGADAFVLKRAFDQEELLDRAALLVRRQRTGA